MKRDSLNHTLLNFFGEVNKLIIIAENRRTMNENGISVHDACFYSFETKCVDGKYVYTFKAHDEWKPEEEYLFIFSGVSSCVYAGENHSYILGSYVNSWYSLPSYPYESLASESLTKDENVELNQHGAWKNSFVRKEIRVWEHEIYTRPNNTAKLFKVVFALSTPAILEIECEELAVEKRSLTVCET